MSKKIFDDIVGLFSDTINEGTVSPTELKSLLKTLQQTKDELAASSDEAFVEKSTAHGQVVLPARFYSFDEEVKLGPDIVQLMQGLEHLFPLTLVQREAIIADMMAMPENKLTMAHVKELIWRRLSHESRQWQETAPPNLYDLIFKSDAPREVH